MDLYYVVIVLYTPIFHCCGTTSFLNQPRWKQWLYGSCIVLVLNLPVCFLSRWNLILLLSICSAVLSGEGGYHAQGKPWPWRALLDVRTEMITNTPEIYALFFGGNTTYFLYILENTCVTALDFLEKISHCWRRVGLKKSKTKLSWVVN